METGFLQINGNGPKNASVGIFDADDNLITETHSDAHGFWSIASVEMECGDYKLRAKMKSESGREHISNPIDVTVTDPDCDVDINAEQWSQEDIEIANEIQAERQDRAELIAGFKFRDRLFETAVSGCEYDESEVLRAIYATGETRSEFLDAVATERAKRKYARIVCQAAAGIELSAEDKSSIWHSYRKTEEAFEEDVNFTRYVAARNWQGGQAEADEGGE